MAWRTPEGTIGLWTPLDGDCPLADFIACGGLLEAHNAGFEQNIWNYVCIPKYGWPAVPIDRWRDSMAQCAVMAVPLALGKAGDALGVAERKDDAGHAVMMKVSRPRKPSKNDPREWFDDPELFEKLYAYNRQDVRAEHAIGEALPPLSAAEQEIWHVSNTINRRGVYIDQPAVRAALRMVEMAKADYHRQIDEATGGLITEENLGSWQEVLPWCRGRGVALDNYQKTTLATALDGGDLPEDVAIVLRARLATGRTSTAKYQVMLDHVNLDGRVRDLFLHHGAGTGRWAGQDVQPQNLPRGMKVAASAQCFEDMATMNLDDFRFFWGDPMKAASFCLRGAFIAAPGKTLISGDYAAIQARIADWLAGQEDAVQVWRDYDANPGVNPDAYKVQASKAFHKAIDEITDSDRQLGKIQKLGCQFGAGWTAIQGVASLAPYFLTLSEEAARALVDGYREAHPHVKSYWYQLESAAINAVRAPGVVTDARGIRFKMVDGHLRMRLPSGRLLSYPFATVEPRLAPWGEWKDAVTFMAEIGQGRTWLRTHTYGGSLFENAVQGIEVDFARAAMLRCEARGLPIVLHSHDEIVVEVDEANPITDKHFVALMAEPLPWSEGLPIAGAGWRGTRYRK